MAAVRKACKGCCEMVFIDAPHIIPEPTEGSSAFDGADTEDQSSTDPETVPRTWWFAKGPAETGMDRRIYIGFEESMRHLRSVIDNSGPFDACLGFSQGAALAAVVGAVCARPHVHPAFADPPLQNQGPLKAIISVAGFKLEEPGTWYVENDDGTGKVTTPNLHVRGDQDLIVGDDRLLPLVESYENPRLIRHEGGHYVPSKGPWRAFWARYFAAIRDGTDPSAVPGPEETPVGEGAKL